MTRLCGFIQYYTTMTIDIVDRILQQIVRIYDDCDID